MNKTIGSIIKIILGIIGWKTLAIIIGGLTISLLLSSFLNYIYITKGNEQRYSLLDPNQLKQGSNGYREVDELSKVSINTQLFFDELGNRSINKYLNKKMLSVEEARKVKDYYSREQDFKLSKDLLYELSHSLFPEKTKYPEQFITPVNFNKENFSLEFLSENNGYPKVMSDLILNGKRKEEKIESVADYGLGAAINYKKELRKTYIDSEYIKEERVVGYTESGSPIKEWFEVKIPIPRIYTENRPPYDIHIIQDVVFAGGEKHFVYERQATPIASLEDKTEPQYDEIHKINRETEAEIIASKTEKKYIWYKNHYYSDKYGNTLIEPLYRERNGAIYEEKPVRASTIEKNYGNKYIEQYLASFRSYIPSVYSGKSYIRDLEKFNTADFSEFQKYNNENNGNFAFAMKYEPIIQKYAKRYEVDPYLILAMLAQESGGTNQHANGDGIFQVEDVWNGYTRTGIDEKGREIQVVLPGGDRSYADPDQYTHWVVLYMKELIVQFNGDQLKALQGYNFHPSHIFKIRDKYPFSWNSLEWMNYRLAIVGENYGDPKYVENVLRYYAGEQDIGELSGKDKGLFSGVIDKFKGLFASKSYNTMDAASNLVINNAGRFENDAEKDETKYIDFKNHKGFKDIDLIIRQVAALQQKKPLTMIKSSQMNIFENDLSYFAQESGENSRKIMESGIDAIGKFAAPVKKVSVTSIFGLRFHSVLGYVRPHRGIDFSANVGDPIYAFQDGVVEGISYEQGGYGNYVDILHTSGLKTRYAHLSRVSVNKGQNVRMGEEIAKAGQTGIGTGPHLHFEIHIQESNGYQSSEIVNTLFKK